MKLINNIKKNTAILLLITTVILIIIFKDNYKEILVALKSMNIVFIAIGIFFFFLSIFLKSIVNYITINDKNKISKKEAFKHEVIVQFFNGITPFSSGGQPMEIYMMTEHGITALEATNISIQNFIFYQTALVLYGIIAFGYNAIFKIFPEAMLLKKLVFLGFLINTLVALSLFLILISKTFTKKVASFIINILATLKIIKDKENVQEKIYFKLDSFHLSATLIRKRKGLFIKGVLLNFLSLTCLYIIPLFIVLSLGDYTSLNILTTLTSSAYVLLIGSFVPIPGASGGIEYGFLRFYGNFLSSSVLTAVLIVWRFITYYLGIILGALTFSLEKKVK